VTRVLAEHAGLPAAPALVVSVAGGSLTYVVALLWADRDVLRDLLAQAARVWTPLSR
jgi:hypothetical protein